MSPDGGFVAAVAGKRSVRLWKLPSGREVGPLVTGSDIRHASFTADGRTLVIAEDDSITLWSVATGKRLKSLPARPRGNRFVVSANGRLLANLRRDRVVELRDLPSGREAAPLHASADPLRLLLSPDSTILVVQHSSFSSRLGLIDLRSRKEITVDTRQEIGDLSFEHSNAILITSSGLIRTGAGRSKIWDACTGRRIAIGTREDDVFGARISRDGRLVAFTDGGQNVHLWDLRKNRLLTSIELVDFPNPTLTLSPDGRVLAVRTQGRTGARTKLWDIEGNREIATLRDTAALDFSANGQVLATHSGSTVSLWQAATGLEIGRISDLPNVIGVHFAPDGKTLIGWNKSGTLMFWPTHLDAWLKAGCAWLARYLELHPSKRLDTVLAPDGSVSTRPLCGRVEGRSTLRAAQ